MKITRQSISLLISIILIISPSILTNAKENSLSENSAQKKGTFAPFDIASSAKNGQRDTYSQLMEGFTDLSNSTNINAAKDRTPTSSPKEADILDESGEGQGEISASGSLFSKLAKNSPSSEVIASWSEIKKHSPRVEEVSSSQRISPNGLLRLHSDDRVEYLIKTDSMVLSSQVKDLFERFEVDIKKKISSLDLYVVYIPVDSVKGDNNLLSLLESIPSIRSIEPNYYMQSMYTPNDPEWVSQWGPQLIEMAKAWDTQLGSRSVKVAIIDTGIDYNHPDLVDNYLPLGYDWYWGDNDPMDDHSHGTHCAGTVAAAINNGIGVTGLANVSIFAEKSFGPTGYGSTADAILAINHAVEQGAAILSNSWGGYGYSSLLEEAVANAAAAGVLFFAAAGNGGTDLPHYPSAYPGAISVAATDASDNRASFSNYGATIDIAAPGVNILSTVLESSYGYKDGTSMATPHVAGLAALLWSEFPSYTPSEIERLLYQSAVDLGDPGSDDYFGYGRINASDAILGLPDHDLSAKIIGAHTIVDVDSYVTVYGGVANLGLVHEADVTISAYINGTLVNSSIIPFLAPGKSAKLAFTLYPESTGFYNLTFAVELMPGEENEGNNVAQAIVQALYKQIDAKFGDILAYGPPAAAVPFQSKWIVSEAFSEAEVWIDLMTFDPEDKNEYWTDYFLLNLYTRELLGHSSWDLFPYWIGTTDLAIDSVVDLYTSGGAEGVVVESTTFEYYGESIAVWLINDSSSEELLYYDQDTGIRLSTCNYSYFPSEVALFTNSLSGMNFHNLRCSLLANERYILNTNHTIEGFVQNTGTYPESTTFSLFVEDPSANMYELNRTSYLLNPGEYAYLDSVWLPIEEGGHELWAIANPPSSETYRIDNSHNQSVVVYELLNYQLLYHDFSWYDAVTNGYNLGVVGDDTSAVLALPFNFTFYNTIFDTVYISSNGWLSFNNTNPTDAFNPRFPSTFSNHYYAVAPFWHNLEADNNIFVWETEDFVVVEYNSYYYDYLWYGLAGTFQVVFFKTGEILFQYLSISSDYGATVGLNYGLHAEYYTAYTASLDGASSLSLFFVPVGYEWHDIAVNLEISSAAIVNASQLAKITVDNLGTSKEKNIGLALYFNGSSDSVKSWTIPYLDKGEKISTSYLWMPTINGTYNFTARVSPLPIESVPTNNEANSTVTVYNVQELGFIEVSVYDYFSGVPVEMAEVQVFLDDILIQRGLTDTSGFYNVTGLLPDYYEVNATGAAFYTTTMGNPINWIGDDDYLTFYLDPVILSPRLLDLENLTCELGSNCSLNWVAVDNNPDIYRLFKDGSTNGTGRWVAGVPITINLAGLALGTYNYTLVVADGDGNLASDTVIVTVISDTFAPQFSSTGDLIYVVNTTDNYIQWTVLDSNPATYNVTKDGTLVDSGSWTSEIPIAINVDGLPLGTHSYVITAADIHNHTASDAIIVTVIGPDAVSPVINSPTDIFYPVGAVGNFIRWIATDPNPNTYTISCNSAEVISGFWKSGDSLLVSVDGLALGSYTYIIVIKDQNGNFASDTVIVIVTEPDADAPDVSHPDDITYVVTSTGHAISWTATDPHPNSYTITRNGMTEDSGIWSTGNPIVIDVDGLKTGTHIYIITVTDIYGNFASDIVIVTVTGPEDEETTSSSSDSPFGSFVLVLLSFLGIVLFRGWSSAKIAQKNPPRGYERKFER